MEWLHSSAQDRSFDAFTNANFPTHRDETAMNGAQATQAN